MQRLPARINKIIDAIANNEMKISVDAIDEKTLVVGFQKVANRITVGLIIAALIVGAAMMMRVETTFRIWGYPGLAILLFLAAAGGRRRPAHQYSLLRQRGEVGEGGSESEHRLSACAPSGVELR